MKDAERNPKTSTLPLTVLEKKSTVRAPQGEPPQAAYLMSLFGWLTQPGLRARVRALEKRLEEVDYEWADWYQKFRTLHARLAKQVKRADAAREESDDGGADGPG